jgi:hypothetical protein
MRALRRVVLTTVLALALVGCGATAAPSDGGGDVEGSTTSAPSEAAASTDPLLLIGIWQVHGTDEPPGTLLRLDARDLSLWRACGAVFGSWRADHDGRLVADAGQSGDGSCAGPHDTALTLRPPWLAAATGFRAEGDSRLLLDHGGDVTARLEPASGSPPRDGSRSPFRDPPAVDERTQQSFATPAPLPRGLRPASRASLAGRWVPLGADAEQRPRVPFLRLDADGSWTSSDGCNGSLGRWTAGPEGRVLATSGGSTAIGCHNVPVDQWWPATAAAGFDGATLVLLDVDGHELGRLEP